MGRQEKGEGGDRGDLVDKKEILKGEKAIKSVIKSLNEMDTEE